MGVGGDEFDDVVGGGGWVDVWFLGGGRVGGGGWIVVCGLLYCVVEVFDFVYEDVDVFVEICCDVFVEYLFEFFFCEVGLVEEVVFVCDFGGGELLFVEDVDYLGDEVVDVN